MTYRASSHHLTQTFAAIDRHNRARDESWPAQQKNDRLRDLLRPSDATKRNARDELRLAAHFGVFGQQDCAGTHAIHPHARRSAFAMLCVNITKPALETQYGTKLANGRHA